MHKIFFVIVLLAIVMPGEGQPLVNDASNFSFSVVNAQHHPAEGISIELIDADKKALTRSVVTNADGIAVFTNIAAGLYFFNISGAGYQSQSTVTYHFPLTLNETSQTIVLLPSVADLQGVTLLSTRPFIEHAEGKVLINVDASVTNIGTTLLEVLAKSPGVMVDKNGNLSLQGRMGVLVMIDDKPTYLSGTELNNLLSGMSASQVDQIELMANPSARYDASGNAGIINIKTKKNKQKGFNGTITTSVSQGRYPKNNNSIVFNYRNGKFNSFLSYSTNWNKYYTDMYALRNYYNTSGKIIAVLEQPTLFSGRVFNNTLKTGIDYNASAKTTIGISLTGIRVSRKGYSNASATWKNAAGRIDSAIGTYSTGTNDFKNGAVNINLKHRVNQIHDFSLDVDWLNYDIRAGQFFVNNLLSPGGYTEASMGNIPSAIRILSAKTDHRVRLGKEVKLESGWKSSHINTDNLADYLFFSGQQWNPDPGKSNHFFYKENIHAFYSSFQAKKKQLTMQAGLRYEYTSYEANQAGTGLRKDSVFIRNYQDFFPSGFISFEADSSNTFTVTGGRRIERPAFQKLNPFVFIINKYTYQTGNPYFLPQYSWNIELVHQYKSILTTSVSYSITKNYFSQLFLTDSSGILVYSDGNVGRVSNWGLSASIQVSPFHWWSLNSQVIYNHKELQGYAGFDYHSSIDQMNFNVNNQFRLHKKYTGELSGVFTTGARNDLQEILYPTGQLSIGVSRPVLKNKGTLKVALRDVFYTQAMEGLTQFVSADEYFILRRDSRVINVGFTWRFGTTVKQSARTGGSAGDEMQRVGNGN